MSAIVTTGCNLCGAETRGTVDEAVAWNINHLDYCDPPPRDPNAQINPGDTISYQGKLWRVTQNDHQAHLLRIRKRFTEERITIRTEDAQMVTTESRLYTNQDQEPTP